MPSRRGLRLERNFGGSVSQSDPLLEMFLQESEENFETAEAGLLALEQDPQKGGDTLNSVFRAVHTLKGNSTTFGFTEPAELAHEMETTLDLARGDISTLTSDKVGELLLQLDLLRTMLGQPKSEPMAKSPQSPQDAKTLVEGVQVRPSRDFFRHGNNPVLIFSVLSELSSLEVTAVLNELPSLAELLPAQCWMGWDIRFKEPVPRAAVEEAFAWAEEDCKLVFSDTTAAAPPPPPVELAAETPQNTLMKIPIEKLDRLVNQVAELAIAQSLLLQRLDEADPEVESLRTHMHSVQETVLEARMQPIQFAFQRLPRMVRDLCQALEKKVDLQLSGEDTELDKVMLEALLDPLMHLTRNAIDHGLESPQERLASGKPQEGRVEVRAFYLNGRVQIEISDDGRGISLAKIRERAESLGWLEPHDTVEPERLREFLFVPGFSTAKEVSEISGRGVGLDVVKKSLDRIGGFLTVDSEPGVSTTFRLSLPLTLAMLDVQTVSAGGRSFQIPRDVIVECQRFRADARREFGKKWLYRFRDNYIPLHGLTALLGLDELTPEQDDLLVVVDGGAGPLGLLVHELLDQERVVVKSLERNYGWVPGVLGASIANDGSVILIIDSGGCLELLKEAV